MQSSDKQGYEEDRTRRKRNPLRFEKLEKRINDRQQTVLNRVEWSEEEWKSV